MNFFNWIYKISCLGLGVFFIFAGGIKVLDPESFAVLIDDYGIVPENFLLPVAVGLSALEVVAGLGLIFDIKGSLVLIAILLLFFIGILSYGIWMGLDIDCGCFGSYNPESKSFHDLRISLYRDLIMLIWVVFMYIYQIKKSNEKENFECSALNQY